jgi:hypothetical protein
VNKEYKKSLNRCPLCGTVVGCLEVDGYTVCSTEEFRKHVEECREASRVKPGKVRFGSEE